MRGSKRRKGTARDGRPRWELRVYAGLDPATGRQRQVSRSVMGSARDADRALRALIAEVEAGRHRGSGEHLSALAEAWYAVRLSGWSPTTAERIRGILDTHVLPTLGTRVLAKLRASDLDRLYGRLEDQGLRPATVRKVHAVMHSVLALGERWEWVAANVADRASPPVVRPAEVVAPSPADVRAVMVVAADRYPGFGTYLRVAAVTGARRGELCGLRRSDLDLDAGTVRIARAVIVTAGGLRVKEPKSGPGRRVDLDAGTLAELADHLARMARRAAEAGVEVVADPYLFSEPARGRMLDGSQPWHPHDITRRWSVVRDLAGVSGRMHSLRHFVATELLGAGVSLPTVSRRLGHRRTSTTSDTYAAHLPAGDRAAAELIGDRLGPRRPTT